MYDVQGRRAALTKLFTGAAAVRTALAGLTASAEETGAESKKGKKRIEKGIRPDELWKGALSNVVYTPAADGDPKHYIITADAVGDGTMRHMKSDRKVTMSNSRLAHYIDKKSGGKMNGDQCMRIGNINWRVHGVDYDAATNTWRLNVKVCESNPNARPKVDPSGITIQSSINDTAEGCKCSCDQKCYHCRADAFYYRANKYYCGVSYSAACD
ncbi:MAG: hypothetical protein ACR2J8_11195 [Thermomicrobiales bacterium]